MSKIVDEGYINNYFKQQEKIIARLKEIAQIMYDNSDDHKLGPYQVEWTEEYIETSVDYLTLKLSSPEPYEDWANEEEYSIPYSYLTTSNGDIEVDVRAKAVVTSNLNRDLEVRMLKSHAHLLGYDLVEIEG